MRRSLSFAIVPALLAGLVLPAAGFAPKKMPAPSPQTYTVLVGWENPHQGIGVMAYFPDAVTIHVGDTVHWVQNANEIHTVTFLAGELQPDLIIPGADPSISALMFNPEAVDPVRPSDGRYDGTTFANSGLMGREEGQAGEFRLTFTTESAYDYLCLVHGAMMSGKVIVKGPDVRIPWPSQARAEGWRQIGEFLEQIPGVIWAAQEQIKPSEHNGDGTMTHHVMIGYSEGQIDLMQFFPDWLRVSPDDTVVWEMSPQNVAPHTVTFLNGQPEPSLVKPVPPLLYANPEVFFPHQPEPDLTREGIYNSGVMNPVPGTTYKLVIGDMSLGSQPYLCLLHDTSGMKGTLMILPHVKQTPCPPVWRWPWPWMQGR